VVFVMIALVVVCPLLLLVDDVCLILSFLHMWVHRC
jgi:hypothetical protein